MERAEVRPETLEHDENLPTIIAGLRQALEKENQEPSTPDENEDEQKNEGSIQDQGVFIASPTSDQKPLPSPANVLPPAVLNPVEQQKILPKLDSNVLN